MTYKCDVIDFFFSSTALLFYILQTPFSPASPIFVLLKYDLRAQLSYLSSYLSYPWHVNVQLKQL